MSRYCKHFLTVFVFLFAVPTLAQDDEGEPSSEPEILSVFPLGGQRGDTTAVELKGRLLKGAHTLLFDCEELQARITRIEEIELADSMQPSQDKEKPEAKRRGQRVWLRLSVGKKARIGTHRFYLVTPQGVSNPSWLQVHSQPNVRETEKSGEKRVEVQDLEPPAIANGTISQHGEVDYYEFAGVAGREVLIEVGSGIGGFDPTLTLYEPAGSWFDPERLIRLAYNDEPNRMAGQTARLRHRFARNGHYVAAVGAFVNRVNPYSHYQLRILPVRESGSVVEKEFTQATAHPEPLDWKERDFSRGIDTRRLKDLRARTVSRPKGPSQVGQGPGSRPSSADVSKNGPVPEGQSLKRTFADSILSVGEQEPNNSPGNGLSLQLPVLIEGKVQGPSDVDYFRLRVESGTALAFEIDSPQRKVGDFSPWLGVVDSDGKELLTNLYVRLGGDGDDWVQTLEPKIVYTFEQAGDYDLWIRDLTSHQGNDQSAYRLLIRPQVPHVGEVSVAQDRLNLIQGEAKKLTVTIAREEGFEGEMAIAVKNLPSGVKVLPAAELEEAKGPSLARLHPERFLAKEETATLVFLVAKNAKSTQVPRFATVEVQPILQGSVGPSFAVKQIPIMVVEPALVD